MLVWVIPSPCSSSFSRFHYFLMGVGRVQVLGHFLSLSAVASRGSSSARQRVRLKPLRPLTKRKQQAALQAAGNADICQAHTSAFGIFVNRGVLDVCSTAGQDDSTQLRCSLLSETFRNPEQRRISKHVRTEIQAMGCSAYRPCLTCCMLRSIPN